MPLGGRYIYLVNSVGVLCRFKEFLQTVENVKVRPKLDFEQIISCGQEQLFTNYI